MKTYNAKTGEIKREWYIVDAAGKNLGRTASEVAMILMGKNKPVYTPHVDTGDYVVIVNAEKVSLTGRKLKDKKYYRHSKWMGSLSSTSAEEMLASHPERVIQFAVKGMLPKSRLGTSMLRKLKVHAGPCPEHGYTAQKARPLELK